MSTQDTTLPPSERAAFEAWAKNRSHPFHDREPLLNGSIDRYSDIAWQAWQARAAIADAKKELQQLIAENAGRAAFLESHPAVSKELCDLIEENERLRAAIAAQAQPQEAPADWLHLKHYGYAPGNYMSRCSDCGQTPVMDKRATRCRPCAETAFGKAQQAQGVPDESYCLWCEKLGHFTVDCHSTHGINNPRNREIFRLAAAPQEEPSQATTKKPDRTGLTYYRNSACKAEGADSVDCICWTPNQAEPQPERERLCATIKAEDDYCVTHGDYMLDSNDCIKIIRGEWVRPDYSVGIGTNGGGPSVSGDPPGSYNNWTGAEVDELQNVLDDVFSDGGTKGGE